MSNKSRILGSDIPIVLEHTMTQKDVVEDPLTRQITAIVIGAGDRGYTYAQYALDFPNKLKIVAVVDPKERRRLMMKKAHNLPDSRIYSDWQEIANMERFADCIIISTLDQMHKDPAVSFAEKGYDILLEKPMSVCPQECWDIYKSSVKNDVLLAVCHVLRYFPPFIKIKEIIQSGLIGEVVNIQHTENVSYWNFSHSYVRGNWCNSKSTSFSLLHKCCHDIDLICYWMGDKLCKKVSSFGSLYHFRKENKPPGASSRCLTCPVENTCPFSAKKIYLDPKPSKPEWPVSVVCDIEDLSPKEYQKAVEEALLTGPYGQCVYECDNDVCDNQIVNMEFEGGSTATMTMIAFTNENMRNTKIFGTRGTLYWPGNDMDTIIHHDFVTQQEKKILSGVVVPPESRTRGHFGSDFFLIDSFVKAVASQDHSHIRSGPQSSLRSHLLVFAAEDSRLKNEVIITNDEIL